MQHNRLVDAAIEKIFAGTLQQIEKDQTRVDTWRRKAENSLFDALASDLASASQKTSGK